MVWDFVIIGPHAGNAYKTNESISYTYCWWKTLPMTIYPEWHHWTNSGNMWRPIHLLIKNNIQILLSIYLTQQIIINHHIREVTFIKNWGLHHIILDFLTLCFRMKDGEGLQTSIYAQHQMWDQSILRQYHLHTVVMYHLQPVM